MHIADHIAAKMPCAVCVAKDCESVQDTRHDCTITVQVAVLVLLYSRGIPVNLLFFERPHDGSVQLNCGSHVIVSKNISYSYTAHH